MADIKRYSLNVTMLGANGVAKDGQGNSVFKTPTYYGDTLRYINIQNLTSNTLKIYGAYQNPASEAPVYAVGAYMQISLALNNQIAQGVQISFINSSGDTTLVKNMMLEWTDKSLEWNSAMTQAFTGGSSTPNAVSIVNQPTVNIGNTPSVTVSGSASVTGDFDGTGSQGFSSAGTANAVNTLTIPGVAGKKIRLSHFSAVSLGAAVVNDSVITISDGASVIYRAGFGAGQARGQRIFCDFAIPIECGTGNSVTISCAAGGTGVIYHLNAGAYYK